MTSGRIDVHSHLLPGVDDGCKTVADAIACTRELVAIGYTHGFVTPHLWPNLAGVTRTEIPRWTSELQCEFDAAEVPYRLLSGGELNLHEAVQQMPEDQIVSMGLGGKYILVDMWANDIPDFFKPSIRWLQGMGMTVILAHPERMRAVQDDPKLADYFQELGILLQGNLQCFSDRPGTDTREMVERFLLEGRYFLLGSDSHNPQSMGVRTNGLKRAIEVAGEAVIDKLTIENPRRLIAESGLTL
jgi:protein-tyrosine phosphatase